MNIEQQIIILINKVAELEAQVSIMWKAFVGIMVLMAGNIAKDYIKIKKKG